jgi:Hemerythrin HHE cation binding domain
VDITEVILEQHHEQRRMFGLLDEMPRDDVEGLGSVWGRLEVLLEVHAEAEERFFYPRLLKLGKGNPEGDVDDEVEDAIKDHNEIRDAIRAAREREVGTDAWWTAVWEARKANDDHMAEEEREDLLDFRHHADLQTRHDIAVQFLTFEARHYEGVPIRDKDPEEYLRRFGSPGSA